MSDLAAANGAALHAAMLEIFDHATLKAMASEFEATAAVLQNGGALGPVLGVIKGGKADEPNRRRLAIVRGPEVGAERTCVGLN